jgi:hypothetical protein
MEVQYVRSNTRADREPTWSGYNFEMKSLEEIQQQLQVGRFEFTRHALKRSIERDISEQEIKQTSLRMELIEDYPDDKYSPSCLLLGFTQNDRVLHLQVSRADSDTIKIITLYEPDPTEWIDFRRRKSNV